jgi:DNA-binding response OmpR family regulator
MRKREEKVLIVENDPSVAQAVELSGARIHLKADRVTDGWEAIEKLEKHDYAAIVIDADLPGFSGYGVVQFLRQEQGEALENVIMLTSGDREDVLQKISAERLHVLRKSTPAAQLDEAMSACASSPIRLHAREHDDK